MAYRPLASSFAEGIGSNEFHTASGDVCPVAINVFPAGSIPACRPVTYTKMIICSIDPSLVSELSAESDLAVTLIQRFGSAANLNIHLHCRVLDSVWRAGSQMGGVLRQHSRRRRRRADRNRFSPVRRFWRQRGLPNRSVIVRGKRNGPYGRLHGTLGERSQKPANERLQTCEQSAAAISCATCSDPNGCDARFRSGSFGAHDNLGGSKRTPLPFYRRSRIYDSADRGSRNCLF
jgi:hypothetical protein